MALLATVVGALAASLRDVPQLECVQVRVFAPNFKRAAPDWVGASLNATFSKTASDSSDDGFVFEIDEQAANGQCLSLEWENHTKYQVFGFASAWVLKWGNGRASCLNNIADTNVSDSPDKAPPGKWQCNEEM